MALTKEQLMAPRYKIIAGWPRSGFPVGLIFTGTTLTDLNKSVIECGDFPHLFRKLEWHENREVEDMPKYVWYDDTPMGAKKKTLRILRVDEWIKEPDGEIWARIEGDSVGFATAHMPKPSTEAEFNSQKQTTNG